MTNTPRKPANPAAKCIVCNEPVKHHKNGQAAITCGRGACLYARRQMKGYQRPGFSGWPQITDKDTADYRPHEIEPGDGGLVMRAGRKDRGSYTGCSAGYAMDRGSKRNSGE